MQDFSLRQLEYFVAVVEDGSVTGASRRLRVSPGGVSLAVSQLEESLGLQLTLRVRGRGASLTSAGKWVYQEARSLLAQAESIRSAARTIRGELVGPLRVGCFSTLSPWLFPRIAAHFAQMHPGVEIQLVEGPAQELRHKLQEGDLDVALLYRNHLRPGLIGSEILPVRLQIALHPDHPLAAMDEISIEELAKDDNAILLNVEPARSHVEELMSRSGVRANVKWMSVNPETIRSMVARGLGYSIIMGRPHSDVTYDGLPITYRRIADDLPQNAVVIAYARGLEPTQKITTLIEYCRREFAADDMLNDRKPAAQN